jgi:hypothetical protein
MAPLMGKCDRKTIGKLVQFLTGHCFLLRHQICKINPHAGLPVTCRLCKDAPETPEHLIRGCPTLMTKRREIFNQESLEANFEWSIKQIQRFIEGSVVGNLLQRVDL